MSPAKPVVLDRPAQVRAVSSPVAHQIISVMERARRCTVTELAQHTGIEAGSLYYHVRKMKKIGLLLEREKRSTGGRQEVVYELAGSEVIFDPQRTSPGFLAALGRVIRTRFRYVERVYQEALSQRRPNRRGRRHPPSLHQHHARLNAANRSELYRRIEELEAFLIEHDDPERRDFLSVTIAVVPILRR